MQQRRFKLAIRKNFFTAGVVKHWNRLLKEVVESPALEAFISHEDVALRDVVEWWTGHCWINS